jgi:hypothetical protein
MSWTNERRKLRGAGFILTLMDDFTKKTFIYTIRMKSYIKDHVI